MYHDQPKPVRQAICSAIAAIIYRNLSKGEILHPCDQEISDYWKIWGFEVPDAFREYDYFDQFFTLDGSVDLDRMEDRMYHTSADFEDDLNTPALNIPVSLYRERYPKPLAA